MNGESLDIKPTRLQKLKEIFPELFAENQLDWEKLKAAFGEDINFDTTENLFIEGEKLEVLKVLQKAYYGKVKCIIIDPPYNTGSALFTPINSARRERITSNALAIKTKKAT